MGILNRTPDSFSDGGLFFSEDAALKQTEKMILDGADIIDIGAQSTRPGAEKIDAKEEMKRLGNLILKIKKHFPEILISLDTYYAEVVQFGFDQGIDMVNDISGGQYDADMFGVVAQTGLPYILMHVNTAYQNMHHHEINEDIILHLNRYFSEKAELLKQKGVKDIILDPGFGFGKTLEQNHQLIDELRYLGFGEFPILVGISRKSFIYKPLGKLPSEITQETQTLHKKLLEQGAKIFRVHDVAATQKTLMQKA